MDHFLRALVAHQCEHQLQAADPALITCVLCNLTVNLLHFGTIVLAHAASTSRSVRVRLAYLVIAPHANSFLTQP